MVGSAHIRLVQYKLKLGSYYMLGKRNKNAYKLIQVTPKGFNFIADDKSRTLFDRALWGELDGKTNIVRISIGSSMEVYELVNYEIL